MVDAHTVNDPAHCFSCEADLGSDDNFCRFCGAPAPGGGAAELRVVTVLAFELPGYSPIFTRAPELRGHPRLGTLRGHIEQLITDAGGVLVDPWADLLDSGFAIFGARTGDLEQPDRAIRAASDAQVLVEQATPDAWKEAGTHLVLRVGIATGAVVADTDDDGTVVSGRGTAMSLAHHLAAHAEDNTLIIDEVTARAVAHRISLEPRASIVMGLPAIRIPVFLPVAGDPQQIARHPTLRVGALGRAMVGRQDALETLLDHADAIAEQSQARRVIVRGAQGIGRSRLVDEAITQLRGRHPGIIVGRLQIPSQGSSHASLGILGTLFECLTGFDRGDDPDRAATELEALFDGLQTDDGGTGLEPVTRQWIGVLLGLEPPPISLTDDAEYALDAMFHAVVAFCRAASSAAPIALLVEGAAQGNAWDRRTLSRLTRALADRALLMVVTDGPAPGLMAETGWFSVADADHDLDLEPLNLISGQRLIDQILSRPNALSDTTSAHILAHTGGNPLFIEETLGALADAELLKVHPSTGAWRLEGEALPNGFPDTLEDLLVARIDQMPEAAAAGLRRAAVVGRVFWRGLLEDLGHSQAEGSLEEMAAKGRLTRCYDGAIDGHEGYQFAHEIVRRVAAKELDPTYARALHGKIARWLSVHTGTRFHDWLGPIAGHFAAAGDTARAVSYHHRAAQRAQTVGDVGSAVVQLARALALVPAGEEHNRLRQEYAEALMLSGQPTEARAEAEALLATMGLQEQVELKARVTLVRALSHLGALDSAEDGAQRGLTLALQLGATAERGHLLLALSRARHRTGREQAAAENAKAAHAAFVETGDQVGQTHAGVQMARTAMHLGQLEAAAVAYKGASELAQALAHPELIRRAAHGLAWTAWLQGHIDVARERFEQLEDAPNHWPTDARGPQAALGLALIHLADAEPASAVNLACRALAMAKQREDDPLIAFAHGVIGHIYGTVEIQGMKLRKKELSADALEAARTTRVAHLAAATQILGAEAPLPRLTRALALLFRAEYLLAKDGVDPVGWRTAAQAQALFDTFESSPLKARAEALPTG